MASYPPRNQARDNVGKQDASYRALAEKFYGSPVLSRRDLVSRCREALNAGKPFALGKWGPSMLMVLYAMLRTDIDFDHPRVRVALFHGHAQAGLFPPDPKAWVDYCRLYAESIATLDITTTLLDLLSIEVTMIRRLRPARMGFFGDGEPDRPNTGPAEFLLPPGAGRATRAPH